MFLPSCVFWIFVIREPLRFSIYLSTWKYVQSKYPVFESIIDSIASVYSESSRRISVTDILGKPASPVLLWTARLFQVYE